MKCAVMTLNFGERDEVAAFAMLALPGDCERRLLITEEREDE